MDRIGGPLRELLHRLRLTDAMEGWRAVELWPDVVGEKVAGKARAMAFQEGILIVEVDSAAWMNELTYLKRRVIAELNRRLGDEVVSDLKLVPAGGGKQDRPPGPGA